MTVSSRTAPSDAATRPTEPTQWDSKRVRFVTYGCKANQYDTQVLREALARRGWSEAQAGAQSANAGGECDLAVVNTCTVTAEAGRKARQLIRRLKREQPDVRIAVTGCLAESEPEMLREIDGVEWVLGNGEAKRPVNFLRQLGEELSPEELGIPAGITEFAGHTRAFLKIQDGCDMACAYCIIPHVRGRSRSRDKRELAAEVGRLLEAGHREVVLCGIHIGHWGLDCGEELADLLETLAGVEHVEEGVRQDWRLRLSSIEATEVDGRVLDVMARNPERIAPHLHMPMQSGDDGVLQAMNRWYTVAEYLACCERIRERLDRPAFTADILVGFPGETDEAFANTLGNVRSAGFTKLHVFPFSARPGTAAEHLGQVPRPEAVRERRAQLSEVGHELSQAFLESLDGAVDTVVLEGAVGLSGRYQRVKVDLDEWTAEPGVGVPPPVVRVRLERRPGADGESALIGRRA
ncbi:MAG: tRNA (N(6)-L-threonylcarbamoyladenosine(37)-C(2))-methylthiotransferase MtaB [Planctomycetota bacterium]